METTNKTEKLLIVKSGYYAEEIRYKRSEFNLLVSYLKSLLNARIQATIVIIDLEVFCEKKYNLKGGKLEYVEFSYQLNSF